MKHLIILFIGVLLLSCNDSKAQDSYITEPTYSHFWGAATDTLIASDTISEVVRIQGKGVYDITFGLYVTKVSGTVTNNFVLYASMDNSLYANWQSTGDTIKLSNFDNDVEPSDFSTYKDAKEYAEHFIK